MEEQRINQFELPYAQNDLIKFFKVTGNWYEKINPKNDKRSFYFLINRTDDFQHFSYSLHKHFEGFFDIRDEDLDYLNKNKDSDKNYDEIKGIFSLSKEKYLPTKSEDEDN